MKANAAIQQDLGSDSGAEKKITAMGLIGIPSKSSSSFTCSTSYSKYNNVIEEKKRVELFHMRIISKHIKIDTLFDSGSQENLISVELVRKLGLEAKNNPKPYPLGWLKENNQMQDTK